MTTYDAIVVGSGPNGLAAAIRLAQAGLSVAIFEAKSTIGGGTRSLELTLPGFIHDVCSAIHPLAAFSPFFLTLPLKDHGLEWIFPPAALAHPFDATSTAFLEGSVEDTARTLNADATAYKKLLQPLVKNWQKLSTDVLSPFHLPKHPLLLARFASIALRSATALIEVRFQTVSAQGLFAGLAAHSMMPLEKPLTSAFALVLAIHAHLVGWPIAKGGSQQIAEALASYFRSLGGTIITDTPIHTIDELPPSHAILCDVGPKQLLQMAGHYFPENYRKKLEKFRYGPAAFKMDWALSQPIPWKDPACSRAGTLHLGGKINEIQYSENQVWNGKHPDKPFVILAQQSLFDLSRAPLGKHTAWGYCHVPHGSTVDMTTHIENQIERFAPGFKECILARSKKNAKEIEEYNPNYVGGDINGGVQDLFQLFSRPAGLNHPYATPNKKLFLCSSSTPPGGGVHGMCGYLAATAALKRVFK